MRKIIDVSAWQGTIDWKKVAEEVDMAILRASCGLAKDTLVDDNVCGCQENGIPFGVYHYLMATSVQRAREEADRFYRSVRACNPAFWAADVEYGPLLWADGQKLPMNPNLPTIVRAFVDQLRQRVGHNARIIYYGGESVYEPYGKLSQIPWDGLWIANYNGTPKMDHDLHQYTSSGRVSGIGTRVDLNRLAGKKPLSWWTGAGTETEKAPDKAMVRVTEPHSWHIRSGDGSGYESLMIVGQGTEMEYVATAVNGWLAVRMPDGRIGWISPRGAKVVTV